MIDKKLIKKYDIKLADVALDINSLLNYKYNNTDNKVIYTLTIPDILLHSKSFNKDISILRNNTKFLYLY